MGESSTNSEVSGAKKGGRFLKFAGGVGAVATALTAVVILFQTMNDASQPTPTPAEPPQRLHPRPPKRLHPHLQLSNPSPPTGLDSARATLAVRYRSRSATTGDPATAARPSTFSRTAAIENSVSARTRSDTHPPVGAPLPHAWCPQVT